MPHGFRTIETWQWNQYVIAIAAFTTFVGFNFVTPFLPLFIQRDLSVRDPREVAFWSGLLFVPAPLLSAISGPVWGSVADRIGYKRIVQRILLSFAVILALMSLVQNVWQLFIMQCMVGIFGGFTGMSMALITHVTPRDRSAQAVGLMQGARYVSDALGPLLGGWAADRFGIRQSFWVSATLSAIAFILLTVVFHEDHHAHAESTHERTKVPMRSIIAVRGFIVVALILFLAQAVNWSFPPTLPLFVAQLEGSSANAASLTGLIVSVAAVAAAVAAASVGRLGHRRELLRLLSGALLAGMLVCLLLALSQTTTQLFSARVLLGVCAGSVFTLAYTHGGSVIDAEMRGAGFGLLTSATLIGGALSPLVFGALAGFNLRWVFGVDALIYGVTWVWVLVALKRRESIDMVR